MRLTMNDSCVHGDLTRWLNVESEIGQGDIQGPPIFYLAINLGLDLAEKLKTVSFGLRSLSISQAKFKTA